jgi:hypothetical protein
VTLGTFFIFLFWNDCHDFCFCCVGNFFCCAVTFVVKLLALRRLRYRSFSSSLSAMTKCDGTTQHKL